MVSASPIRKKPFDILVYPFDFRDWLPSGMIIGTASATAIKDADGSVAVIVPPSGAIVRPGGQYIDVVIAGGAAGETYTVSLQAVTDLTAGPLRPQKQEDFKVIVF